MQVVSFIKCTSVRTQSCDRDFSVGWRSTNTEDAEEEAHFFLSFLINSFCAIAVFMCESVSDKGQMDYSGCFGQHVRHKNVTPLRSSESLSDRVLTFL